MFLRLCTGAACDGDVLSRSSVSGLTSEYTGAAQFAPEPLFTFRLTAWILRLNRVQAHSRNGAFALCHSVAGGAGLSTRQNAFGRIAYIMVRIYMRSFFHARDVDLDCGAAYASCGPGNFRLLLANAPHSPANEDRS